MVFWFDMSGRTKITVLVGFVAITCVVLGTIVDSRLHEGSSAESYHSRPDWSGNGNNNSGVGLSPPVGNLAANSKISTNATCGITGPETYCKLLEHVFIASRASQCLVCESHSPDRDKRHSIEYAIDGSNRWWQSPTLQKGPEFEWITITLDLKQVYQVAYIVIKAAISPRPANWILERSSDGINYTPWQYYAATDEECWNRYRILAKPGKPTYDHDEEVICTSYFSKISPFEGGEIHTSLINGRPGAIGPTETLIKFTMARFVRLRLQKISTLKADLMRGTADTSVKRRYFYSIKDIAIGGHCICFGHSSECVRHGLSSSQNCLCQHQTCGERCDRCCPLFNQRPWSPGNSTASSACESCQCHGHADACVYDPEIDRKGLSINKAGVYSGGGICLKCKAHTSGINCEKCQDGYYRPRGVLPSDKTPCIQCQCNSVGSTGNCITYNEHPNLGKKDGECICKEGFTGKACTECAFGFRGFQKCEPCPCNIAGIVNTDCEGECRCKRNVDGQFCSMCKKGFFYLDKANPEGCTACFCNGFASECVSSTLPVIEMPDQGIWFLTDMSGQKTVQAQNDGQVWQVHNDEVAGFDNYYWTTKELFTGKRLSSYGLKLTFFVSWIKARGDTSGRPIPEFDVIIQGSTTTLAYSHKFYEGNNATISVTLNDLNCLLLAEMDNTIYRDNSVRRESPCSRYDVMKVLADIKRVLLRGKFHTDQIESMIHYAHLEGAGALGDSGQGGSAASVEICSCPEGYIGNSCDECAPGYQKTDRNYPLTECIKCNCNGHSQNCDSDGNCKDCENHTAGSDCGTCAPGYFRNSFSKLTDPCKICECPLGNPSNNFSPTCIGTTTSFECNACPLGYDGMFCERCSNGYFGNPENLGDYCKPCTCNVAVHPGMTRPDQNICDRITGECFICPNNTFGWDCSKCREGFYGNSAIGCLPCNCEYTGSLGIGCHQDSGQCTCRIHFAGAKCNSCVEGFTYSKDGCIPCNCDPIGSASPICNSVTGDCACKLGVGESKCTKCASHYYGYSASGCKACDPCEMEGHICDPMTGRCICPPNSEGKFCEKCTVGFWGNPSEGCKACNCSQIGSSVAQCSSTGQCLCATGYTGRTCNACEFGYYNYPQCKSCGCDSSGTIVSYCREDGKCSCSETGHCYCKENVIGQKCDRCKTGSYGLQMKNPLGCESCFCFHRTNKCSQGNFKWQQLALPSMREVQVSVNGKSQMKIINNLIVISDNGRDLLLAKDVSFGAPMYWQLPHIFLGDKVLSYKGLLRFHLTAEGGRAIFPPNVLESYPLIQIQGNHRLVLEHFTNISSLVESYEVRLHEDSWRLRHGPLDGTVTKEIMMIALQNVQHILIRGTISPEIFNAKFFNVSLDTAVPALPGDEVEPTGLEICECPSQYNSTSCQNPTAGYYRWHKKKFITSTVIIDLVGEAKPCECNGRSRFCDIETGYCQNCTSNTSGFHCDQCLTGYYGNPIDVCQPCPCPSEYNNHADTCTQHISTQFQCFCKPGYVGALCERCDYGFYGNPGETCEHCECNTFGSVSDECHEITGQCNCRPGITGRDCSRCANRHVIVRQKCVSCDDPCTGTLLNEIEQIPTVTAEAVQNAQFNIICDNLSFLEEEWKRLDTQLNAMHFMGSLAKEMFGLQNTLSDTLMRISKLKSDAHTGLAQANSYRVTSASLYARINLITKQIYELINMLEAYSPGKRQPFGGKSNSLAEARALLAVIEKVNFRMTMQEAIYQQQKVNTTIEEVLVLSLKSKMALDKINQMRQKLTDLNLIIDKSEQTRAKVWPILDLAGRILASRRHAVRDFDSIADGSAETLNAETISRGYSLFSETAKQLVMLEDVLDDLQNTTFDIEIVDNTLTEFIPDYNELYAKPAFEHVQAQKDFAINLQRRFESISPEDQGALRAIAVYSGMEALFQDVLETAQNASTAAKNANYKLSLILGNSLELEEGPLMNRNKLQEQISALRTNCKKSKAKIQSLQERILSTFDFLRTLSFQTEPTAPMEFDYLDEVIEDLQETIEMIMLKESELKHKINTAPFFPSPNGNSVDGEDANDYSQIRQKMNQFNRIYDWLAANPRSPDRVNNKIQYLKSLVLQAKHKADTVKIALGPDTTGTCLRLYKWASIPSVTSMHFNFMPVNESDSLLVFWPSSINEGFMSIEMIKKHIKASWDLGSGLRSLIHPRTLRGIGENADARSCLQISLERKGASVSLNVVLESNTSSSSPIQYVAASDESSTLDMSPNDVIYVGGMSKQRRPGLVSNGLSGCIHNLRVNQKRVGLWNFVGHEGCSACVECTDLPTEATLGKLDYFFDGTGYATVARIQSQTFYAKYFDISMEFKTTMENGLLFLTVNNSMSQIISMELKNGQVLFQTCHSCSGNQRNMLQVETSRQKLNTGEWIQLRAIWIFQRGLQTAQLTIGKSGQPYKQEKRSRELTFDLFSAVYQVGGISPAFYGSHYSVVQSNASFIGCIKNVLIDGASYDMLSGNYFGVEAHCRDRISPLSGGFFS